MNAAVTFTSCALGRMSWKKFPVYVLGQFLGSFLASVTIYCLFYSECPSLSCLFLASASFSEIWADPTSVSWTVKMSGRENPWKRSSPLHPTTLFLGSRGVELEVGSYSICVSTAAIISYSGGYLTVTGPTATANIFATYLPDHMTLWRGFLDEVSGPGWVNLLRPSPPQEGANRQPLTIERTRTLDGNCTKTCPCQRVWASGPGWLPRHLFPR